MHLIVQRRLENNYFQSDCDAIIMHIVRAQVNVVYTDVDIIFNFFDYVHASLGLHFGCV